MSETNNSSKKKISLDWLMRGVLTKVGDTFDRLTGRRWTPSSSLATSELIEKLKMLLDAEVKNLGPKGKFVPHNIKLKMQWDKFSTDSNSAIAKLENELKIAAIDHINDNRYHTYAPLKLEVTPDYFTQGVKLLASFDKFSDEEREVAINVTVPQIKVGDFVPPPVDLKVAEETELVTARFDLHGKSKEVEITFASKQRRNVGRSKENDLSIEDQSVSKIHATLVLSSEKQLLVADTGSTNGTFINGQRIAYGRAFPIAAGDIVKFGNIEVNFEYFPKVVEEPMEATIATGNIQPPTMSASQKDIQTVAFASNDNVSINNETLPPRSLDKPNEILPPVNIEKNEILAPKILEKTEVNEPLAEEKRPEVKDKSETQNNPLGTKDRIVFDFTNED